MGSTNFSLNITNYKRILLFALFFCFSFIDVKGQEYPLVITAEGHLLIQVAINDSIKGNFILDTGAGAIVLSQKMFDKVSGSTKHSGYFTGFRHDGDRIDGSIYTLPSLAVGNVKCKNIQVGIYPPLDNYGIDGLLSLKFFENKPFSIDYKSSKLRFINQEKLKFLEKDNSVLPILLFQHTDVSLDIFIPICLNKNTYVDAEFDTGSGFGSFVLNPNYITVLNLDTTKASISTYTTPISGRKIKDNIYTLDMIGICEGQHSIQESNVKAVFREGLIYEALIGSQLFKEKIVTIDIPGKKFIISN